MFLLEVSKKNSKGTFCKLIVCLTLHNVFPVSVNRRQV